MRPYDWRYIAAISLLALAGCATPPVAQLREAADGLYSARGRAVLPADTDSRGSDAVVAKLLTQPVDADAAVQIALLQNPRIKAIYARLGIAQADLFDAARLSNPLLGYMRLGDGGEYRKVNWSLSQSFTELLFQRFRKDGAQSRVLQAEQQAAHALMSLEADVREAHIRYLGSRNVAAVRDRIARTAQVAATYGQQLFDAGNTTALQRAAMLESEHFAAGEALRAQAGADADRNSLLTLLGLPSDTSIALAGELAPPGVASVSVAEVREWALGNRLDLLSAREALHAASLTSAHARRWRWLGQATVGVATERDRSAGPAAETLVGPSASLELPIFNSGRGSAARAQAAVDVLASEVQALELSIGNDVATRIAGLEAARKTVALHRQHLLPLQQLMVEASQKQQNYMLIGIPDLLASKRHQYEGYESYLVAVRDYWLACNALLRAAGGQFPGAQSLGGTQPGDALSESAPAAVDSP